MLWNFIKSGMLRHPDSRISEGERSCTFAGAAAEAERLAASLLPGKYAVRCASEYNAGLSLLACLAAGVTAIPLSERYGDVHCERILNLTAPDCILTDSGGQIRVLPYERQTVRATAAPDAYPALIMCTSGTTGAPKGAMISAENLMANLRDIDRYFDLRCTDRILISRPLYHCAVLTGEFLISLLRGTDIRFYSEAFNPAALLEEIVREKITALCGTPTLFSLLSRLARRMPDSLSLRLLVSSGECMTRETAAAIRQAFPDTRVMNVYGLTEASPRVAYLPPELFDAHPEAVGYPLHSLRARVVDAAGAEVPRGTDGELLISGPSVMQGYYRAPEATEKALRGGWLHTGDMAAMDDEGRITIKCRKDNMIILAGMNIYPQEIECALRADENIEDVLAFGARDADGRQYIGVRVVAPGLDREGVAKICRRRLPAYERPSVIELADSLPKNASGKLIRPKDKGAGYGET